MFSWGRTQAQALAAKTSAPKVGCRLYDYIVSDRHRSKVHVSLVVSPNSIGSWTIKMTAMYYCSPGTPRLLTDKVVLTSNIPRRLG